MAKKYIEFDQSTGHLKEVEGLDVTTGASDAEKIVATDAAGKLDESLMPRASASETLGAGDAGKYVILDSTGKVNDSMMPTGVGADMKIMTASEGLSGGNYVNVWSDAGTAKVRKADASDPGKLACGFVKDAVIAEANASVYFEGINDAHSSLTPGARYFLSDSAPGTITTTPPSSAGSIAQFIGKAISATEITFEADQPIVRA